MDARDLDEGREIMGRRSEQTSTYLLGLCCPVRYLSSREGMVLTVPGQRRGRWNDSLVCLKDEFDALSGKSLSPNVECHQRSTHQKLCTTGRPKSRVRKSFSPPAVGDVSVVGVGDLEKNSFTARKGGV